MFSLFLASIRCEKCNSSEGLEPGYICCDNVSCLEKYCYVVTSRYTSTKNGQTTVHESRSEQCLTKNEYTYCFLAIPTIAICVICCLLPTLVAIVGQYICNYKIPTATILFNIGSNISIGLFLSVTPCFNVMSPANIVMLVFGIVYSTLLFVFERVNICKGCEECRRCCMCCSRGQSSDLESVKEVNRLIEKEINRFNPVNCNCCAECCPCCCSVDDGVFVQNQCCFVDSLEVLYELKAPVVTKDALETIIVENSAIPPTPQAEAIGFLIGRKGSPMIVDCKHAPISYGSWQETGAKLPSIKNETGAIVYKCKQTYQFEDNMAKNIETAQTEARKDIHGNSVVHNIYQTTGQTKTATGTDGKACITCCASCYIKDFFYTVLMFFGYNGLIDACWRANTTVIEYLSHKVISSEKNLRALAGERDRNVYIDDSQSEAKMKADEELVEKQSLLV